MAEIENTTIESDDRQIVGKALQGQLVDLIDLSLFAKQLHWNVVGPNFRSIHLQLDDVVEFARMQSDVMAERAVALAVNPDGQTRTVTDSTPIKGVEIGWLRDHEVVAKMTEVFTELIGRCRERIESTEKADPATQDLIIAVCQGLEEQHWMFQAQV